MGATTLARLIPTAVVTISACTGFSYYPRLLPTHRDVQLQPRPKLGSVPNAPWQPSKTPLKMGLFDFIQEKFLDSRQDDFVPLDQGGDDNICGPGPLLLMYAVPESIDDNEFKDMIGDGMPGKAKEGVVIRRLSGMNADGDGGDFLLDLSVGEALNEAMKSSSIAPGKSIMKSPMGDDPCPVLYFSGVSNAEMMATYRIIAREIYDETGGRHWPACAKVVLPAMGKSLRRVLNEISSDHAEAMRIRREGAEDAGGSLE